MHFLKTNKGKRQEESRNKNKFKNRLRRRDTELKGLSKELDKRIKIPSKY